MINQEHYGSGDNIQRDKHVYYNAKSPIEPILTKPVYVDGDNVIGRESALSELQALLINSNKPILIKGMRGIGKTTLTALYFTQSQSEQRYKYYAWLENKNGIADTFLSELPHSLNITFDPFDNTDKRLSILLAKLANLDSEDKKNLLIIDNADVEIEKYAKYLPMNTKWDIILTSPARLSDNFITYKLDVLKPEDSYLLFKKLCPKENIGTNDAIKELLKLVGYHTLTVEMLAKTINESFFLTVEDTINYLKNHQLDNDDLQHAVRINHSTDEETIFKYLLKVFYIATNKEDKNYMPDENIYLLKQFAVLPSVFIDINDFIELISSDTYNKIILGKATRDLEKKGWLESYQDKKFKMHNIIQEIILHKFNPSFEDCQILIERLTKQLRINDNNLFRTYSQFIDYATSIINYITKENPQTCDLFDALGTIHRILGNYSKALEYYEKVLKIRKNIFGENSLAAVKTHNDLIIIYQDKGLYDKAINYYFSNVVPMIQQFPKESIELGILYQNISSAYRAQGENDTAFEYIEKSLIIQKNILGETHASLASIYNNLGDMYMAAGKYEIALEYLNKALSINKDNLPKNHYNLVKQYSNMGLVYKAQGEYNKALECFNQGLECVITEKHPDTALIYNNMGTVYEALGEWDNALKYYKKSNEIRIPFLGEHHPEIAVTYNNMGLIYTEKGEYEKTLEYCTKALSIAKDCFGENHARVADIYHAIAIMYYEKKEYKLALEYFAKVLKIEKIVLPENHFELSISYNNLALIYFKLKEYNEALNYFHKAIKIIKLTFGDIHPGLIESYINLAHTYYKIAKFDKTLEYFFKVLTIKQKFPEGSKINLVNLYNEIASCYQAQNNIEKALEYRRKAEKQKSTAD